MFARKSLHVLLGGALLLTASRAVGADEGPERRPHCVSRRLHHPAGQLHAGYLNLVMTGLESAGIKAVKIPAGISGHKSNQMLARLERDVIQKKTADHDPELRR